MGCKLCEKKIDGFSYQLNDGIYCEDCWQAGLIMQKQRLRIKTLVEELNQSQMNN